MLGFSKRFKRDDDLKDTSDRELIELLYREVVSLKETVEDLQEQLCDAEKLGEVITLKKEIRENNSFMQQLVLQSLEVVKDKAAKPSTTELYYKNKQEREAKEAADAEAKAATKKKNSGIVSLPG
mgnify:CR=1 FL=1